MKTYPNLIQITPYLIDGDQRVLALFDDGQIMECYLSTSGRMEWIDFPRPLPRPIEANPKRRTSNRMCDRG